MNCPTAKAETLRVAERFRSGDHDAVYDLVGLYGKRLRGFLRVFVVSDEIAEDLAQDVFVRAYVKRHTLSDPARIEPWLFAIARNVALREVHRKVHAAEVSVEEGALEEMAGSAPASDPAAQLHAARTAGLLHVLLGELDEKRRTLMALRYFAGLSHREIADALQIPIGSVGTTIARTLETLRKNLDARGLKAEDLLP